MTCGIRTPAALALAVLPFLALADAPAARAQGPAPGTTAARTQGDAPQAVPTRVVVRAISRGAKIIGDGVGGAMITIVDAATGATLAEGRQRGNTGDTELIMSTPRTRDLAVYTGEGAAKFEAELPLERPTVVNIAARGPLGHPQAVQAATKRMLLVPGGHIEGEGVLLELHGFIVEVQDPAPMAPLSGTVPVRARVRMTCGCPLTPGGLWDADAVEIRARLIEGGRVIAESPLAYAGEPSTFSGRLEVPAASSARGELELEVVASNPAEQNFGRHAIPVQ